MKVSSERIEGCQAVLNIEVEPEEMEKALEGAYRRLVNKVDIPGFRKGKAPRHLLERHIGKESMDSEALDRLVPELYQKAIEEQEIDAIAQPELEVTQMEPPIIKATVPLRPVAELGDYSSIRITPEDVNQVSEDEIEQSLMDIRQKQASWEPVEREARLGDMVTLNVEGTVEGNTVLDRKDSQYQLLPESEVPVPGFAVHLHGIKVGEEKEFTLPFPEKHPSSELAGKECHFKASITEVKEERVPELDDEFVKSLGQDLETVEQLRERVAENLKAIAERDARTKLESQALEAVIGMANVEFPSILLDDEIDRMAREQLAPLGGMNLETYLGYRGITNEDFRGELRPSAEKRIIGSVVLNKLYEVENIEVSDAEIDEEIDQMMLSAGGQSERMQKILSSSEARDSLRGDLLTRKTIDRLVEITTAGDIEPAEGESAPEDVPEEVKEEESDDN